MHATCDCLILLISSILQILFFFRCSGLWQAELAIKYVETQNYDGWVESSDLLINDLTKRGFIRDIHTHPKNSNDDCTVTLESS